MEQTILEWADAHARKTDPSTSHTAAKSMRSSGAIQRDTIERVLLETGGLLTGEEIAERCGLSMVQVCRRLPDLQKQGRARPSESVTRPTSTGRQARCWGAVFGLSGDAA